MEESSIHAFRKGPYQLQGERVVNRSAEITERCIQPSTPSLTQGKRSMGPVIPRSDPDEIARREGLPIVAGRCGRLIESRSKRLRTLADETDLGQFLSSCFARHPGHRSSVRTSNAWQSLDF